MFYGVISTLNHIIHTFVPSSKLLFTLCKFDMEGLLIEDLDIKGSGSSAYHSLRKLA